MSNLHAAARGFVIGDPSFAFHSRLLALGLSSSSWRSNRGSTSRRCPLGRRWSRDTGGRAVAGMHAFHVGAAVAEIPVSILARNVLRRGPTQLASFLELFRFLTYKHGAFLRRRWCLVHWSRVGDSRSWWSSLVHIRRLSWNSGWGGQMELHQDEKDDPTVCHCSEKRGDRCWWTVTVSWAAAEGISGYHLSFTALHKALGSLPPRSPSTWDHSQRDRRPLFEVATRILDS